ncbi:MAG TPA: 3-hydroxyacyl-ACP dehydratase FabZ [bacterium]|nr:3-hydroxyacyl-ACP dehydratase FabZ [bacterium]
MLDRMDVREILRRLPHRYPFLLVDRILELEPGKRIVGLKNVSINEPFFVGHFPGHPIMPGVLVVEAMAQVAAVLVALRPDAEGYIAHLVSIQDMRFRRPVHPGDQLITEVISVGGRGRFGKADVTARVNGQIVAEGHLMYGLVKFDAGPEDGRQETTEARYEHLLDAITAPRARDDT